MDAGAAPRWCCTTEPSWSPKGHGVAAYFVVSACTPKETPQWKLWTQEGAEFSQPGLILSVLAMPIMYFLSHRKLGLAEKLGSRALMADAVESITCGWLGLAVVATLIAQRTVGNGGWTR